MKKGPSKKILTWLKRSLLEWEEEGIIPESAGEKIREKYHLGQVELIEAPSRTVSVLATIGALLFGAGILLLIASNWQAIPRWVKVCIIFATIFGINHLGYYLKYTRGNYPRVGGALIFLGAILFGAGIWLIAQIYHITSRYHSGLLFWALGILPVAWLLRSRTILTTASFLLSFWGIWKAVDFKIPNYPFLIPMLMLIIPTCYREKGKVPLFVSAAGISIWFIFGHHAAYFDYRSSLFVSLTSLSFGAFLYASGVLHSRMERTNPFAWIYLFLGSLVSYLALYSLSFRESYRYMLRSGTLESVPFPFFLIFSILAFLSLAQIAAAVLCGRKQKGERVTISIPELSLLVLILAYSLSAAFIPDRAFHGIVSNALLLTLSVGLIYLGYHREQPLFVNTGFVLFGIHFVTRYLDWGWKYLPRSAFFLLAGVILILGATILERKRRRLIGEIRVKTDE